MGNGVRKGGLMSVNVVLDGPPSLSMRAAISRRGASVAGVIIYDQLAHLFAISEPGSVQAQMQERLDGCQVLAYRTSRVGARHFTRALRASLDAQALRATRNGLRDGRDNWPADVGGELFTVPSERNPARWIVR